MTDARSRLSTRISASKKGARQRKRMGQRREATLTLKGYVPGDMREGKRVTFEQIKSEYLRDLRDLEGDANG